MIQIKGNIQLALKLSSMLSAYIVWDLEKRIILFSLIPIFWFFALLFKNIAAFVNEKLDQLVKTIGSYILKIVLCLLYFTIILPLRIFYRAKDTYSRSSFISRNQYIDKTHFERPW